jgi:exosortase E/protease (VPEID-CTERM system)
VQIAPECSGYEGIALITVFLVVYLWLFRKELRFPHALLLFPLGVLAIWIANGVRIGLLIIIGTSLSPEVAVGGFHSQAGWIAFTAISVGLIALAHRARIMVRPGTGSLGDTKSAQLASALLVPFMVLMAATMVTSALSSGFDALYPCRVLAATAALWFYRKAYPGLGWSWSWQAVALGAVVFLIWVVLEPANEDEIGGLESGLSQFSGAAAAGWLGFRVLGSVITVPLAEELAFRGYLIRKLVARDFENVRPDRFAWLPFVVSSVLFGLLHGRWFAGTLAGMAYALALYRRGQLGDAIAAHMCTNALIAVYVLMFGRWSLW